MFLKISKKGKHVRYIVLVIDSFMTKLHKLNWQLAWHVHAYHPWQHQVQISPKFKHIMNINHRLSNVCVYCSFSLYFTQALSTYIQATVYILTPFWELSHTDSYFANTKPTTIGCNLKELTETKYSLNSNWFKWK